MGPARGRSRTRPNQPAGPVVPPPRPVAATTVTRPAYLSIPVIDVRTRLIRLGLTAQGTLQVPVSTSVAGWYTGSPRPGQVGSAIIAGHIDSYRGPGVFFRLRLLRPGDRIYVRHADGTLAVFRVYAEHMLRQGTFPDTEGVRPDARPGTAPHHLRRNVRSGARLVPEQRRRLRCPDPLTARQARARTTASADPAGFQKSAMSLDLVFYAARSYSLMRPPRTGRRLIRSRERSATG